MFNHVPMQNIHFESDFDPYEEALSDHETRFQHDYKEDYSWCGMCKTLFDYKISNGEVCRFHPGSYFEPKTKTTPAKCEECELEELL